MPTWLKCKSCGREYYTATSEYNIDKEERCQECQGDLAFINKMVEKVLNEGQSLDLVLREGEERFPVELNFLTEQELGVKAVKDIEKFLSREKLQAGEECRVSFSCRGVYSGRYYFYTELLSLTGKGEENILLAAPDYLVRRQERRAPRFPGNIPIKYRIGESLEKLESSGKDFSKQEFQTGKALNFSSTGMLLADDKQTLSQAGEDYQVTIKVEEDQYDFSLRGQVARISDLSELEESRRNELFSEENYLGLGIHFLELSDENHKQLENFKLEKLLRG